ncbi:MAG: hypothetical protein ACI9OJ_002868, partial [Myxococcota bacterium]
MEAFLAPSRPVNQFFGVYPAIVVDNKDPEGRYRVKVKFPWMMESDAKYVNVPDKEDMPSTWCRMSSILAGKDRGAFFLPEPDDEVLISFMFGSFREPVVVGQMYNGTDTAWTQNKEGGGAQTAGENNIRSIRSRSGHMLSFVDAGAGGAERLTLQLSVNKDNVNDQPALGNTTTVDGPAGATTDVETPDGGKGGHMITLDGTGGSENITISDQSGALVIKFDTVTETLLIYSAKNIIINAKDQLLLKCKDLKVESDASTEFLAGSTWKQES